MNREVAIGMVIAVRKEPSLGVSYRVLSRKISLPLRQAYLSIPL